MDDIKFNKYRQAGDIANVTLEKAKSLCHDKLKASYICNFCDSLMIQLLNNKYKKDIKGITLPTCLSINNIVSHYSYDESNDYEVKEGDIIKIELACHIDNNVASIGDTIKVGDPTFNESDLMIAANKALEIGIKNIQLDHDIYLFSDILQKVAKCFNLKVVKRQNKDESMVYDWIFRDTERFNEPSWIIKKEHELVLEDDELDSEEIYIGHDYQKNKIEPKILYENSKNLILHIKGIELKSDKSLNLFNNILSNCHFFTHQEDDFVITNKGWIWSHPRNGFVRNTICVLPEKID